VSISLHSSLAFFTVVVDTLLIAYLCTIVIAHKRRKLRLASSHIAATLISLVWINAMVLALARFFYTSARIWLSVVAGIGSLIIGQFNIVARASCNCDTRSSPSIRDGS
jgi:hypothetical protein